MNNNRSCSVFGMKRVEKGIFEWRIKLKTKIKWFCIGLIKDEIKVLQKNQISNNSVLSNDGLCLYSSGNLYVNGFSGGAWVGYCDKITEKETLIIITLNMDKKSIKFKINGKQYETKPIKLSIRSYRLIATMGHKNDQIELL